VFQAAFGLAQREGLEAVSMRRVAQALGVEAMSLYHHVEGKAALLDGVFELVLGKLPPAPRRTTSWQRAVKERAESLRAVLLGHPRLVPLFATRPAVTLESLRHVEHALELLRAAGLSARASLDALQVLVAFVVGHAVSTVREGEADRTAPGYETLDAAQFPRVTELIALLPSHDVDAEFRFGLDTFIAGLERRLESPR
jgi:AcrR family transcriptional regulator